MPDLFAFSDWLAVDCLGITDVAMKLTGAYWKPICCALEADFEVMLVNARHVRPGNTGPKDTSTPPGWPSSSPGGSSSRASFDPSRSESSGTSPATARP